ncbi:hypothetical protein V6R21_24860 [Limibacter armeniacum]
MMEIIAIAGLGLLLLSSGTKKKKESTLKGVDTKQVPSKLKGKVRTFEL